MRRQRTWSAVFLMAVAFSPVICASPRADGHESGPAAFHFIAFGDMPYHMPGDTARFEELLAGINEARPVFSVHVGDIKSGTSNCSTDRYQIIRTYFDSIDSPLIYTPGDNDWSDCDRIFAGGYDSNERLAELRRIFFPQAQSMGRNPIPLLRQADQGVYPDMVENAIWHHGGITFATVHIVGSDNNLSDDRAEFEARNRANLDWIATAFRMASERGSIGAAILFHADIFSRRAPPAAFADTISAITAGAEAFGRPVLLVNGDAHIFGVDNPIRHNETRRVNRNITRLIVFGGSEIRAVRVSVDPLNPKLFSILPLIINDNFGR